MGSGSGVGGQFPSVSEWCCRWKKVRKKKKKRSEEVGFRKEAQQVYGEVGDEVLEDGMFNSRHFTTCDQKRKERVAQSRHNACSTTLRAHSTTMNSNRAT